MLKIGIIREGKTPPDSRVPLSPRHCKAISDRGIDLKVQPSPGRCFTDEDYKNAGIKLSEDMTDRDILLGVKEVPIDDLLPDKTYFFFSHTIKEQAYNRDLLQAVIKKNITLVDYEVLTNENGGRVIAFGKFAGMVGAHNALWTYGQRTGAFELPRMKDLLDYAAAKEVYKSVKLPATKIILTGTGRVSAGAAMVLDDMGIQKVRPMAFVTEQFEGPVYTQVNSFYYAKRRDGREFDMVQDFYDNPSEYESDFHHFLPHADIMINGIYWDNNAPAFFTKEQMQAPNWNIKVIADVTCDIAPVTSIPSTIKASTIADPIFGYDRKTGKEVSPHGADTIDMMTIDNLPNELPRDASEAFGDMFMEHVLEQLNNPRSELIQRGTVAARGQLGKYFRYLEGYLAGK